jgi:hypothetical protein
MKLVWIRAQRQKGARWYTYGPTIQAHPSLRKSPLQLVSPEVAEKLLQILKLNRPHWTWKLEPAGDKIPGLSVFPHHDLDERTDVDMTPGMLNELTD